MGRARTVAGALEFASFLAPSGPSGSEAVAAEPRPVGESIAVGPCCGIDLPLTVDADADPGPNDRIGGGSDATVLGNPQALDVATSGGADVHNGRAVGSADGRRAP